jgi:hypothetical protein
MSARALLDDAERYDHYRARCFQSEANSLARKGQLYEPSIVSADIAAFMNEYAESTPLLQDARILVLHPSADSGFPHTRPGNIICMPAGICRKTLECRETLLHEAIHLHQRANLNAWIEHCRRLGWDPISSEQIPPHLLKNVRINPDTLSLPFWAWKGTHVPLPLFSGDRLSAVDIRWYNLSTGEVSGPPTSFTVKYGAPSQPEHPFEILAVNYASAGSRSSAEIFSELNAS